MAKSESSKKKFSYEQVENIDAVFNYLSMVNKGLKNRHLSLGDDGQLLELSLPDQVKLTIKAQVKSTKGSLAIELNWVPEDVLLEGSDDEDLAAQEADEEKVERKALEKAERKAEKLRLKAAEQAVKLATKEAEKAAKEIKAAEKAAASAAKLLQKGTETVEKVASKTTKTKKADQNKAAKKSKSKAVAEVQAD